MLNSAKLAEIERLARTDKWWERNILDLCAALREAQQLLQWIAIHPRGKFGECPICKWLRAFDGDRQGTSLCVHGIPTDEPCEQCGRMMHGE